MDVKVAKVKQYNSTYKHIVMIDGVPVCITRSGKKANECIQYLNGCNVDINDGKIKRVLDEYSSLSVNKDTKLEKKGEEKRKIVTKFMETLS